MSRIWSIQEAKKKFNEMLAVAQNEGPQVISKDGTEVAVVVSFDEYRAILRKEKPLSAFFRESPLAGIDLKLERDKSPLRNI